MTTHDVLADTYLEIGVQLAWAPKVNLIQPYGISAFANLDVMVYSSLSLSVSVSVSNISAEMAIVTRSRELRGIFTTWDLVSSLGYTVTRFST
ncbi:hypothetical protein M2396_001188 [Pseudomonas sp. BIGb0278]|uniref:hypothetical protein n=1 Tax=Pseudomonas sp. BIGb0278 TaxID=2940607 RepID=UPI00216A2461|nr:hypothetical protein [Pseudomonas sp. BIGb0278]MCS4282923.1 hypothetical protein [Pseudomonas sp. BIGb0278]